MTENEMVGWHHHLNGYESEQALGVGDGQGNLACCSPWSHKESDTTEPNYFTCGKTYLAKEVFELQILFTLILVRQNTARFSDLESFSYLCPTEVFDDSDLFFFRTQIYSVMTSS